MIKSIKIEEQMHGESFYDYMDRLSDMFLESWGGPAAVRSSYRGGTLSINFDYGRDVELMMRDGLSSVIAYTPRKNVAVIAYDDDGEGELIHVESGGLNWSDKFKVDLYGSKKVNGMIFELSHKEEK